MFTQAIRSTQRNRLSTPFVLFRFRSLPIRFRVAERSKRAADDADQTGWNALGSDLRSPRHPRLGELERQNGEVALRG